jgi:Asp-tRNA(Asn)/Glu-tRNA(Gln) amidotransferase A subunit family amidase
MNQHVSTTSIDVVEMTVDQAAAGLANGTFSAEELTIAFLERIKTYNPVYNAIIFPNPQALDDACEIDRRRKAGEVLGPLAGIPIVVKDTMDMAGFPTTGGWHLLYSGSGGTDLMPDRDSPVVARMRAAGCVILGKTNVPVLSATGSHANDSWAGPTLNSAAPDRMPGGSSAGTAAAVGTSMAILGLAEETGGSIQNPASAQGLVGLKPTFALVPNAGVMPLAGSTRDVVGPIARCVKDAALVMDAIAGYCVEDPKTVAGIGKRPVGGYAAAISPHAMKGAKLGLYGPGWRDRPLSDATQVLYKRAQDEMVSLGATMIADPLAGSGFADLGQPVPGLDHYDARGMECVPYDLMLYLRRLGSGNPFATYDDFAAAVRTEDPFGPNGVLAFMNDMPELLECLADPETPPSMAAFLTVREQYLAIFDATMAKYQLDALVFPQMRDPLPPRVGEESIHETTVCEINIAGLPALTIPAGYYEGGSPFNLVFVGPLWSEVKLLSLAADYEQATQHRKAPDLLSAGDDGK